MRPLLILLGMLSTLVMAQSVLASTSLSAWPEAALEPLVSTLQSPPHEVSIESVVPSESREMYDVANLALLIAGISGLVVAGERRDGRQDQ